MNDLYKIISSRTRSEIFRILFGIDNNEYHLRDIQRMSGLTIGPIRKEVMNLVDMDLIEKRISGNRTYYKANLANPLYHSIRDLIIKTVGLKDILEKALSNLHILYAFVFGSIATDKTTSKSDIDLFVVGDETLRSLSSSLKKCSENLSREINPFIISKNDFLSKKSDHFISNVIKSPKIFIIGNEYEFEKLAR